MANIARLGVALGLNTAEFQTGLKGAMASLEKVKNAAVVVGTAIVAAGTAFAYMTKKSIDNMDELAKQAQMAGVTTESLSALAYAADLAGVSQESLVTSMARLSKGMSDAAMGTGEALKGFNALNIDYKNLESTDDALLQISERFAGLADGTNKTAIAISLFGRSGAQLIPFLNGGREGFEQLRAEAEKLGLVLAGDTTKSAEQFNDSLTQLGSIFTGLINQTTAATLPILNSITQALFNSFIEADQFRGGIQEIIRTDLPRWLDKIAYGFAFTADIIGNVINVVRGFVMVLQHAGDVVSYVMANIEYSMAITDAQQEIALENQALTLAKLKQNEKDFDAFQKEKIANSDKYRREYEAIQNKAQVDLITPPQIKPQAPAMVDPKAVDKMGNMLKEAQLVAAEFERERQHGLEMLQIKASKAGMATNEKRVQEAVNAVLDATSAKLQEISDKREKAAGQGADSATLAEYDRQASEVERLGGMYAEITRQMEEATIASQMTFTFGWNKAFAQFSQDAQNYGAMAADMFGSLVSNMNTAIDNFVETGKLSFSDFAESVIKDIIKIQLKMQASQLLQMGIKFAIGAFSAGAGTASGGVPGGDPGSYSTFASGGTITGPSIVGENGPELFIPGRSGAIIPNNNLSDAIGGGGVTYNGTVIQNMSAIDTQSGLQFLAKNKMNIYALNMSAMRSIPAGR
jgi:lambda family phage tail tape measure protein